MVARGDLGMEIPSEKVPLAQKWMITKCNIAGKFCVTATQMLESMCGNPLPTRAEMTDVSNSVLDGTDCTMLSGETANGIDPANACATMAAIAANAEMSINYAQQLDFIRDFTPQPTSTIEATMAGACKTAIETRAGLIIIYAQSGTTACLLSKYRPPCPILVVTTSMSVARNTNGHFGQYPCVVDEIGPDTQGLALDYAVEKNYCDAGSMAVVITGLHDEFTQVRVHHDTTA
jgi:pyruvate kinase